MPKLLTSLSPTARIAALIAVCVAVSAATSATAATLITGRNIKDGTVTGADIKDHSLGSVELANSVAAKLAGYPAIGYAKVLSGGGVDLAGTKLPAGVNITKAPVGIGEYCVERGSVAIHGLVVQPVFDQMTDYSPSAWVQTQTVNCPAGTDFTIRTLDPSGLHDTSFYVLLW